MSVAKVTVNKFCFTPFVLLISLFVLCNKIAFWFAYDLQASLRPFYSWKHVHKEMLQHASRREPRWICQLIPFRLPELTNLVQLSLISSQYCCSDRRQVLIINQASQLLLTFLRGVLKVLC